MQRSVPLVGGENYHIYNRGAHKQNIFTCEADYKRFVLLLFLANRPERLNLRELFGSKKYKGESFVKIYGSEKRSETLVNILAYTLMPNHFHLIIQPKAEGGASKFMKKLLTAYAMYFNTKYEHSGVIFQGPFKSRHIDNEAYFRYIFAYIHLNPLSIAFPNWEPNKKIDTEKARSFINSYAHSSFSDYYLSKRPEREVLALDQSPDFLKNQNDLTLLLEWLEFTKDSPLYKGESFVSEDQD